jgi:hypothetical protein
MGELRIATACRVELSFLNDHKLDPLWDECSVYVSPQDLNRLTPINNGRHRPQLWRSPAELPEADCARRPP